MSFERVNHRGERLDLYGTKTVYEGAAREERYLVWYGYAESGKYTGVRQTFQHIEAAIVEAESWQRAGYDVKISDRLVTEESP